MPEGKYPVGSEVTGIALGKYYGKYYSEVLSGYFQTLPRKHNKFTRLLITRELPTKVEYVILLDRHYTWKVSDAISNFFSTVENLRDSLQEAYDNFPEQIQSSSKGESYTDAISELENIVEQEVPEGVGDLAFVCLQDPNQETRRNISDNAQSLAQAAVDRLSEWEEEERTKPEDEQNSDLLSDVGEVKENLENAINDLENITWPGFTS